MIATVLTFLMCSSIGVTVSNLSTNEINYVNNDISNIVKRGQLMIG